MGLKTGGNDGQKKFIPGPGQYNPKTTMADDTSVKYSMGAKTKVATSILVDPDGGHKHHS